MLNPLDYGARGDGINDDSDIINSLITDNIVIDLGNKTFKCNKTLKILNKSNISFQNGILDFTDLNEKYEEYSQRNAYWTTIIGIMVKGGISEKTNITRDLNNNSNFFDDYTRIKKDTLDLNDNDYIYLSSDKKWWIRGNDDDGLVGEITQIKRVNSTEWTKFDKQWNIDRNYIIDIKDDEECPDNEIKIHLYNNPVESFKTEHNSSVQKINFCENINFNNITFLFRKHSVDELNSLEPNTRVKSHRKYERENTYVNEFSGENEFKFLGTGLWIEYGLNINVNNCKFMHWYVHGINTIMSYNVNITNNLIEDIYANGMGYGVCVRDASKYINIKNNIIKNTRHAVSMTGLGGQVLFVNVDGNKCLGCRDAGLDSHAIGNHITFQNNTVFGEGSDYSHDGIIHQGGHSIVKNNAIYGRLSNGIKIENGIISEDNYMFDCIITNNLINGIGDHYYSSALSIDGKNNSNTYSIININNNNISGFYKDNIFDIKNLIGNLIISNNTVKLKSYNNLLTSYIVENNVPINFTNNNTFIDFSYDKLKLFSNDELSNYTCNNTFSFNNRLCSNMYDLKININIQNVSEHYFIDFEKIQNLNFNLAIIVKYNDYISNNYKNNILFWFRKKGIENNKYKLNKNYIQKKLPKNEELVLLFVDNKKNVLDKSNIFII
jgi:hypothetical protein